MNKTKAKEITQLVTIELVRGRGPIEKTSSATTFTPSPAANRKAGYKCNTINETNLFT